MSEIAGFTASEKPESHLEKEISDEESQTKSKEELEELLRLVAEHGTKLTHDLSQPLTFMLTSLEMGSMDGGLNEEDCQLLLNAALQMRTELQTFRDQLRVAEDI